MPIQSSSIGKAYANHRFHVLDGLRGVAAFFVIFRHFPADGTRHAWPLSFLAVDFFFVLSGFVLEPGLTKNGGPVPFFGYMTSRAIRVWPTYLLGASIAIAAQLWVPQDLSRSELFGQLPGTVLLFPLYKGASIFLFPLIGPAWSLFAEFWLANLIFALFYARLGRRGTGFIVIISAIAMILITVKHINVDFGYTWKALPATAVRVIFSFSLGCLLRSYRKTVEVVFSKWLFLGLAALLVLIFGLPYPKYGDLQLVIIIGVMPSIVWLGSFVNRSPAVTVIGKTLGELSYPLYTLHAGLGMLVSDVLKTFRWQFSHSTIVFAVLFLPLAWLVARYYDEPVRAQLTDKLASARSKIATKTLSDNAGSTEIRNAEL